MTTVHHRAWRKLRDRVVAEEPHCWLQLPGCTGASTTADHIIPRSVRPDLTMARSNLRGACEPCNKRRGKTDAMTIKRRAERAAGGPPALRFFA